MGYDLADLRLEIDQKAEKYEIHALKTALDEQRREIDELRARLEALVLKVSPVSA